MEGVVGVVEERTRTTVAALGDVVRITGNDGASEASHAAGGPNGLRRQLDALSLLS